MAVLLLPFDDYGEDYSPPKGSILDHPHWLSLALIVAHTIAERSKENLVLVAALPGFEDLRCFKKQQEFSQSDWEIFWED